MSSNEPTTPLPDDPNSAAGTLVPDARGEFVASQPGGAFDPRSFRADRPAADGRPPAADPGSDAPAHPPVDAEQMSGPGEEIDKTR